MAGAPTGLAISNQAYNGYRASWTNNDTYTVLDFWYRTGAGGAWTIVDVIGHTSHDVTEVEGITVEFLLEWNNGVDAGQTSTVYGATVLRAPVASAASVVGADSIKVDWTCDAGTESGFRVYYKSTGGYGLGDTVAANSTTATIGGLTGGVTYTFKVVAYNTYVNSDDSNEVSVYLGAVYTDTVTSTCTASDVASTTHTAVETITDTCTASDVQSNTCTFVNTITDTCTASDLTFSSQTIRTNFAYYWGTADGYVHTTAESYLSDNGTSITSEWTSKTIDFAEADPENTGKWKTIYRIEYIYKEDYTAVPTIFKVSSDGGATWTTQSKTWGTTGDGRIEHGHYHWNKTGQFFVVKIEWPSTDKAFQFLGFDVIYEPGADQWEVV